MTTKDAIIELHERDSNFSLDVSGSSEQDGTSSVDIESESENSSAYTDKTFPAPGKVVLKEFVSDVERGTDRDEKFELPDKQSLLRRKSKLPFFSQYRRLAAIISIINLALLAVILAQRLIIDLAVLGYMVIANVFVSIVIREQSVINFLFWIATRPSRSWPLSLRWRLGKIYHFGGLHSGCSVAATIWFLIFTVSATFRLASGRDGISVATLVVTYVVAVLLITIIVFALPSLRSKFHNTFEMTHRFLGWSVLGLMWAHAILLINDSVETGSQHLGEAVVRSPTVWLLVVITLSIASSWKTLRKVPVTVTRPSSHAVVVRFDKGGVANSFPGCFSTISLDPLTEWHSFANVPKPGEDGYRIIISRAGDWTSRVIDNPPSHFYVKGIATAGAATVAELFSKVLFVATGSGIGPILPHLLSRGAEAKLFWSTRTPVDTFGQDLVDEIYEHVPDAVIHDTTKQGKPDMVARTYSLVQKYDAEAVVIISNQKLTRKVVYGMESRGIPAFGAIWDS